MKASRDYAAAVHNGKILYDRRSIEKLPVPNKLSELTSRPRYCKRLMWRNAWEILVWPRRPFGLVSIRVPNRRTPMPQRFSSAQGRMILPIRTNHELAHCKELMMHIGSHC
jgi:hypothetical protein